MIIQKYGLQWLVDGRGDEYILNENNYRCIFDPKNETSLRPEDVWLDIGAHYGSFAIRAAKRVRKVIAVEPAPDNFQQLLYNIRLNLLTNVISLPSAVIAGEERDVDLAMGRTFDYTHRIGRVRGRNHIKVRGININTVMSSHHANKIKMDCEGSEEEIMRNINYSLVEEIILEWHFTLIPDSDWSKLRAALRRLEENGFKILRAPKDLTSPTKRWTAIIWARKE